MSLHLRRRRPVQSPDLTYFPEDVNLEFSPRRQIVADPDYQAKNEPWLFVGGDIAKGPDVINGIANGHLAAIGIDRYLKEKE